MKQIYFIITLVSTLTIGIISLTSGITFAQNETSEIEDSPLITTPELEESVKADNNTSSYGNDNKAIWSNWRTYSRSSKFVME